MSTSGNPFRSGSPASEIQPTIINGGSKLDMFLQLIDAGRITNPPLFELELAHPRLTGTLAKSVKIGVQITCIELESGEGECWNISGTVISVPEVKPNWVSQMFPEPRRFKAWYQTNRREGFLSAL